MSKPLPKIYPYARVSTTSQLSGTGLSQQTDPQQLEQLSAKYKLPIEDGIQDIGRSAYHGEHLKHELGAFLQAIKQGHIATDSILVVHSLDRLSRLKLGFAKQIYLNLTNAGVHIYSTLDNHLYKAHDIGSEVLSSVIFERAHNESKTKSARTVGNALKLINDYQNGIRSPTGEPVAIKSVGTLPWFIDGSDGTVKQHPYYWSAAELLAKRIIEGVSIPTIKDELDKIYPPIHPPLKKDKWLTNTLRHFHKLTALQGNRIITLQGTEHHLEGYYPKLLTNNEYAKLQAARAKRDTYPVRKEVNLITGIAIAKCSCGSAVANRRRSDHRATLFCLSGTRKENDCSGWYMSLAYAEKALVAIGKDVFSSMSKSSVDTGDIDLLKLTIKDKQEQLKLLNQRFLDNKLPTVMIDTMLSIETDLKSLNKQLKSKELDLLMIDNSLSEQWNSIEILLPEPNDTPKRNALKTIIKKSVNKITFNRLAKSHFKLVFEFVNGHIREVELIKGKLSIPFFNMPADGINTLYSFETRNKFKNFPLHELGIENMENDYVELELVPIQKDTF
jgi:DNA invertase Pin-like site-specific DNA recombinase